MELPIIVEGERAGTLMLTERDGGWLAEAELRDLGRVARLYLFGGSRRAYLGIPEPEGGRMRLVRTLPKPDFEPGYCAEETESPPKKTADPKPEAPPERGAGPVRVWMGGRAYYF